VSGGPYRCAVQPEIPAWITAARSALSAGRFATIEWVAETGSTNSDLSARAADRAVRELVLVADHQTAGRGRLDRSWVAPPGSSIAVSVLVHPAGVDPRWLAWLPLLAGLAVVDALEAECRLAARLKWPNDVLVPVPAAKPFEGQPAELHKVAGLLAELVPAADGAAAPSVVVGAGINLTQSADQLPVHTATSLRLAGAASTDRDGVLRAYLTALHLRYQAWLAAGGNPVAAGLDAAYRDACATLGERVRVQMPTGEPLIGLAQTVDDEGRLVLLADGVTRVLAAGDVVHLRT